MPVKQIWLFPRVKKTEQGPTDASAECLDVVQLLYINEVRLVLLSKAFARGAFKWFFPLQGTNGIIREPCFHSGYRRKVKMSVFNEGFCTKRYELNSSFYPLFDVDIHGTGRFQQCQQSIIQLFNTSYCPYSSCSFNGVFLPPLQGQFGVSLWNNDILVRMILVVNYRICASKGFK